MTSKREEAEQHIVEIAEELKELHEDKLKLSEVQYRLWARMLVTGKRTHPKFRQHSTLSGPTEERFSGKYYKYSCCCCCQGC